MREIEARRHDIAEAAVRAVEITGIGEQDPDHNLVIGAVELAPDFAPIDTLKGFQLFQNAIGDFG
jgi:hypothetical protein